MKQVIMIDVRNKSMAQRKRIYKIIVKQGFGSIEKMNTGFIDLATFFTIRTFNKELRYYEDEKNEDNIESTMVDNYGVGGNNIIYIEPDKDFDKFIKEFVYKCELMEMTK